MSSRPRPHFSAPRIRTVAKSTSVIEMQISYSRHTESSLATVVCCTMLASFSTSVTWPAEPIRNAGAPARKSCMACTVGPYNLMENYPNCTPGTYCVSHNPACESNTVVKRRAHVPAMSPFVTIRHHASTVSTLQIPPLVVRCDKHVNGTSATLRYELRHCPNLSHSVRQLQWSW